MSEYNPFVDEAVLRSIQLPNLYRPDQMTCAWSRNTMTTGRSSAWSNGTSRNTVTSYRPLASAQGRTTTKGQAARSWAWNGCARWPLSTSSTGGSDDRPPYVPSAGGTGA